MKQYQLFKFFCFVLSLFQVNISIWYNEVGLVKYCHSESEFNRIVLETEKLIFKINLNRLTNGSKEFCFPIQLRFEKCQTQYASSSKKTSPNLHNSDRDDGGIIYNSRV